MTVVRGETGRDGFIDWSDSYQTGTPMSPARALLALIDDINPLKNPDTLLIPKAMGPWKMHVIGRDHTEVMLASMTTTVILLMLPIGLQDIIFQSAEAASTFEEKREEVKHGGRQQIMSKVEDRSSHGYRRTGDRQERCALHEQRVGD
jgi:hypothetical protein